MLLLRNRTQRGRFAATKSFRPSRPSSSALLLLLCAAALSLAGCGTPSDKRQPVQFLEFYTNACEPCQAQRPIVERLERNFPQVAFRYINADEESVLATRFRIESVPCLVILAGGEEVQRLVGLHEYQALAEVLSRYAPPAQAAPADR